MLPVNHHLCKHGCPCSAVDAVRSHKQIIAHSERPFACGKGGLLCSQVEAGEAVMFANHDSAAILALHFREQVIDDLQQCAKD